MSESTHIEERDLVERRPSSHRARAARLTGTTVGVASIVAATAGAVAVALGGIGLAGGAPRTLAQLALVAVGSGLMLLGTTMASRYAALVSLAGPAVELGGGVFVLFVGGGTAATLGILALAGIAPVALVSIGAIVIGGTLALGASGIASLAPVHLRDEHDGHEESGRDRRARVSGRLAMAAAVTFAAGLVAAALGVLALTGVASGALSLVAGIVAGAALALAALVVAAKMTVLARDARRIARERRGGVEVHEEHEVKVEVTRD